MIKRLETIRPAHRSHGLLPVLLTLTLLCALLPSARIRADESASTSKLSRALQTALDDDYYSCVWSDPSRGTVRVLIQTVGPVSPQLLTAVTAARGSVVRQFTSINGILAELPKGRVLGIAARADVERITADHLGQQSSSHLEVATGADRARASNSGLDGSGVGIAILDSGIMAGHSDFGSLGNLL